MSDPVKPEEARAKADFGLFLGVIGLVVAFLIPLLQANGVDVNWQVSIFAYLLILAVCVWSFLRHAVPDRGRKKTRVTGSTLLILLIGALGVYATRKQYAREHTDDLHAVRIAGVSPAAETVNTPYVFTVDIDNTSSADLAAQFMCVVAKPNIPLKPFGNFATSQDTTQIGEHENELFQEMDKVEAGAPSEDLPAETTVHGYCKSSWKPDQEELDRLHHGDFTLYIAGRVSIPSRSEGAHVDVDFCRSGSEKFGLQNCFGHNVPRVHH
jgi:hypothetical protein